MLKRPENENAANTERHLVLVVIKSRYKPSAQNGKQLTVIKTVLTLPQQRHKIRCSSHKKHRNAMRAVELGEAWQSVCFGSTLSRLLIPYVNSSSQRGVPGGDRGQRWNQVGRCPSQGKGPVSRAFNIYFPLRCIATTGVHNALVSAVIFCHNNSSGSLIVLLFKRTHLVHFTAEQ